jgi:ubiquinone/menaquinone biosynthesis C-methylase UbiE
MKTDYDQKIVEKILQFVPLEEKRVLEIGCGNGRITSLLVGKAKKLIAIDPDAKSIIEAQEKITGADFHTGYGENLEFPDRCFDTVIFTLSLHHQNGKTAITEACRVLKDNGCILIIEPVNSGEVEQIFSLVRNENQETLDAQEAIKGSDLKLEYSEIFDAKWIFENKEGLCGSLFDYYKMPFDNNIAAQIIKKLGAKAEKSPIILIDTMLIQLLKKP